MPQQPVYVAKQKEVKIPKSKRSEEEEEENFGELFPHFRVNVPEWTMTPEQIKRGIFPRSLDAHYLGHERAEIITATQKVTELDEQAIQEAVGKVHKLIHEGKAVVDVISVRVNGLPGCSCG